MCILGVYYESGRPPKDLDLCAQGWFSLLKQGGGTIPWNPLALAQGLFPSAPLEPPSGALCSLRRRLVGSETSRGQEKLRSSARLAGGLKRTSGLRRFDSALRESPKRVQKFEVTPPVFGMCCFTRLVAGHPHGHHGHHVPESSNDSRNPSWEAGRNSASSGEPDLFPVEALERS